MLTVIAQTKWNLSPTVYVMIPLNTVLEGNFQARKLFIMQKFGRGTIWTLLAFADFTYVRLFKLARFTHVNSSGMSESAVFT